MTPLSTGYWRWQFVHDKPAGESLQGSCRASGAAKECSNFAAGKGIHQGSQQATLRLAVRAQVQSSTASIAYALLTCPPIDQTSHLEVSFIQ